MRISGGLYRGRVLQSPPGLSTRPTSDRARQAVFNVLLHAPWADGMVEDAAVMDVFAGTGALGLEALSRGAAHAVFAEQDRAALAACRANIEKTGVAGRSLVLAGDALKIAPKGGALAPRTLVFLDPPYGMNLGAKALVALGENGWLADDAVAVMEMAKKEPEDAPPGWKVMDERAYGVALVRFIRRA